jgi:DNA-binding NarL/FixJ family response regulator
MVISRIDYTEVVGEAENGQELLDLIRTTPVDVILMDVEMPVMNGIDATKAALKEFPDIKVIALTMFNEDEYIQSMMDAGVKGFLLKNINRKTLDKALSSVANGGNYYSEELFNFFAKQMGKPAEPKKDIIKLTSREKEILQLLAEGLSNKEIAEALYISERTVVGHKSNLMAKTGSKSTISLLSYAIKNKLVII